ncbi:transglycosylase SLT domain-containing protein [Sulfurovum sp. XGS-02]|uniref:lytic transglycosylase domain-containing protein n=1 Tax=Sulfurovum sp. XGS-02 TaxID=2925411 RepID=UPI002057ACAC|nr:lytic transglycosylase domain-containing protein [Sulfurovum sp. XGS-02]UPT76765.1 transglycosylase SLT domain-containing protein [Sulfurovum sp. XGS-02]
MADKYPSYTYVFHEFDVDESYLYNEAFISFVSKHEKKLRLFYRDSLLRGKEILPTMQGLLVEDGVSDLFIYLSMVESGFSTDAVSPKKAVGLWQFMPATAKEYNLTVYHGYDERCDTVSATSAAINYLNRLYKEFGKWYLSAMAYNCGEGCVSRAIKRAGTDDLSVLMNEDLKYLPRETRQYMKKILLLAMIGENETLDFGNGTDEKLENALIEVNVAAGISLQKIATLLKMKEEKLLSLNKSFKDGRVPQGRTTYKITIPIEKVYAFYLRYQLQDKKKVFRSHMVSHTVALGETVESIAKLYDVDTEEIITSNHLKNDFLVLDSLLVIPVNKKTFDKIIK